MAFRILWIIFFRGSRGGWWRRPLGFTLSQPTANGQLLIGGSGPARRRPGLSTCLGKGREIHSYTHIDT